MQRKAQFVERDLMKQPLTEAELEALHQRVGSARDLVKPINQKDVEGMKDAEILRYLAENPNSVRRPIVDFDGKAITLGFKPDAKKKIEEELAGR